MTTKVSMTQCANALPDSQQAITLAIALKAVQADLAALAAALVSLTGQLDTNTVAGHPYTQAANNPTLTTAP